MNASGATLLRASILAKLAFFNGLLTMNHSATISSLNRLYHLTLRSFPAYSVEVRPITFRGPEEMLVLLRQIADEQGRLAERIAEAIRERNGMADPGQFPIGFTAWNDVALPRVLQHSADLLEKVAAEAGEIAEREPEAPVFHFAKEVGNLAQRHVGQLKEALAAKAGAA